MNTAISTEGFLNRYPEFSGTDQDRIGAMLDDATSEIGKRVWGSLYERGVYALAAHFLYSGGMASQDENAESAGIPLRSVAGQSAGGLSESFTTASSSSTEDDASLFDTSRYGQEYVRLRKLTRRHILVTR
jgi:hypothetical protein